MKKVLLLSAIVLCACTPQVRREKLPPVPFKETSSAVSVVTSSKQGSVASVAGTLAMDRDVCTIWEIAFSWFDSREPDAFGITAEDAFIELCPGNRSFTNDRSEFCSTLRERVGNNVQSGEDVLIETLCGNDVCMDLLASACTGIGSDQSISTLDHMMEIGCSRDLYDWNKCAMTKHTDEYNEWKKMMDEQPTYQRPPMMRSR